jgi:spectinomycin phosphotransferase
MLEPPKLSADQISARVEQEYELRTSSLEFLPLGADRNTAVYRASVGATDYFLKLRLGDFAEISVAVPYFLRQQGLTTILAPLATRGGRLWSELGDYRMILYPYVPGEDGYQRSLTGEQWREFGATLGAVHAAGQPEQLRDQIPGETFSAEWRQRVQEFQRQAETKSFDDPLAAGLADFLRAKRTVIDTLVRRAGELSGYVQAGLHTPVLCHGDIHPGNLLISGAGRADMLLVDWDNPLFAQRERDLALISGTYTWTEAEGVAEFFAGYFEEARKWGDGRVAVDPQAISYYRYERILTDIALFCEDVFSSSTDSQDRAQSYAYLTSCFQAEHEVELARRGDSTL